MQWYWWVALSVFFVTWPFVGALVYRLDKRELPDDELSFRVYLSLGWFGFLMYVLIFVLISGFRLAKRIANYKL